MDSVEKDSAIPTEETKDTSASTTNAPEDGTKIVEENKASMEDVAQQGVSEEENKALSQEGTETALDDPQSQPSNDKEEEKVMKEEQEPKEKPKEEAETTNPAKEEELAKPGTALTGNEGTPQPKKMDEEAMTPVSGGVQESQPSNETNGAADDTPSSSSRRPTRAARLKTEWKEAAKVESAAKKKKASKEKKSPPPKPVAAVDEATSSTTVSNPEVHVGRIVERNKMNPQGHLQSMIGTVKEYREAERRIPPRWAVHWPCPTTTTTTTATPNDGDDKVDNVVLGEEWVTSDLAPMDDGTAAPVDYQPPPPPQKLPLEIIQQRFEDIVTHQLEEQQADYTENLIPSLILFAALEDALQTLLEQNSLQDHYNAATNNSSKTTTKKNRESHPHPPMYYSANPSSYLQPPTMDDFSSSSSTSKSNSSVAVTMTPSHLAQRVRTGCQWAWDYLAWQQPPAPPPPLMSFATGSARRSLRQPKPIQAPSVPVPVPVQKGGRVAMWWLEALKEQQQKNHIDQKGLVKNEKKEEKDRGSMINEEGDEAANSSNKTDKSPIKRTATTKVKPHASNGDMMDVDQNHEDNEEDEDEGDANKTDDDFDPADTGGEEDDDDELQDVERERSKLTPVHSPTKDTEDEDDEHSGDEDEDEESVDEDYEIEYNNPYLQPNFASFLEYMVRPTSLTASEIQSALCECLLKVRHSKRTVNFALPVSELESVDHVVLDRATPDYPPSGKVALECVSGETFAELQRLDPHVFARCKFTLSVLGEHEISRKIQQEQEFLIKEAEYKQQKVWDRWRFKGIHEGYAHWPSWEEAVQEWLVQAIGTDRTESNNAQSTDSVAASAIAPPEESNDMALAKSLEESEPSGRRRTRRAATSGGFEGVFYGNQSQLTQKQLMDALVRLVKANNFQTLVRFQSLVADDSSNPLRRARIALGKLLYKRNQLLRKSVTTELSDAPLVELLSKKPLVEIQRPVAVVKPRPTTGDDAAPVGEEEETEDATPVVNEEELSLVSYLQSLHRTELQLRGLVLKYLADIPTAIIATAADERAGTMETMDDADFEDLSSVEWHTTGHDLLRQVIFRPSDTQNTTDTTPCRWYKIQDYSPSVESTSEEAEEAAAAEGTTMEPVIVERRMRFRAVPTSSPMSNDESMTSTEVREEQMLILTEAQVRAGMKASEIEQEQYAAAGGRKSSGGHPFLAGVGARITLIPFESDNADDDDAHIDGQVVGHDTVVDEDDEDDIEYRILILPERGRSGRKKAFWATLDVRADDSTLLCSPVDDETGSMYTIEQCDYHSGSPAFQECRKIIDWLRRQSKAGPFLEPVDPIALNVPTYPQVIKNPMDISTLEEKLENGNYSRIPTGESIGQTPSSRMLNGPFRKDVELIFDNAMLFNPPDDWIHQSAAHLKKTSLKKIADAAYSADRKQQTSSSSGSRRWRAPKKSVYVDEDSDVDMYEYESDNDEDFDASGRKRKRKRAQRNSAKKDDLASRAIEQSIRLQSIMRDAMDLKGPLANLPVNSDASSFTMPPDWSCRHSVHTIATNDNDDSKEADGSQSEEDEEEDEAMILRKKRAQEVAELLELHREYEANESAGLRRSSRAALPETSTKASKTSSNRDTEYFLIQGSIIDYENAQNKTPAEPPSSRLELEMERERLHEHLYAKLYQKYANFMVSSPTDDLAQREGSQKFGLYTNGSFPPYLGRIVPISGWTEVSWEIRLPFVIPALRWVIRGLIHSGHLTAVEPMDASANSGVIMTNDIYYWDAKLQPFEILDLKELQRRKRVDKEEEEESEDEVEMSEYEKLRAERVARNAERLKALGLG